MFQVEEPRFRPFHPRFCIVRALANPHSFLPSWFPAQSARSQCLSSIPIFSEQCTTASLMQTDHRTDARDSLNPPSLQAALVDIKLSDEFRSPEADIESILGFMTMINTSFAVLSVSAPGPSLFGGTEQGSQLVRQCNEELAGMASEHPDKLGFLAVLPDWRDVDAALAEIEFIYKTQAKANGVVVYEHYGER